MCGVYMIRCRENGWYYIGGTEMDFEVRFDRHRSQLRRGKGPRLLQACYDLHGEKGFDFVPIFPCPADQVHAKEMEAIATLKPDLNIYGAGRGRARPRGFTADAPTHEVGGEYLTIREIAARCGVGVETIRKRLQRGVTGQALFAGVHAGPRKPYVRRR